VVPDVLDRQAGDLNRFSCPSIDGSKQRVNTFMMLHMEAVLAGLRATQYSPSRFIARGSGRRIGWTWATPAGLTRSAILICKDKERTRRQLISAGLPVAEGASFAPDDVPAAQRYGEQLGWPIAVKPALGTRGVAVATEIRTADELRSSLRDVVDSAYGRGRILIEKQAEGHDYRILTDHHRVYSVVRRDPASVVGDGRSSVSELVATKNEIRIDNPYLGTRKKLLQLDDGARRLLGRQRLDPSSVPERGRRVRLNTAANLSRGGDSTEVLDETHPTILAFARRAIRSIPGLRYGGLDVMLEDHGSAVDEQAVCIIEVNHNPELTLHHFPMYGPPRNVSRQVVRSEASAAGMTITDRVTAGSTQVVAQGDLQRPGYRGWVCDLAQQLRLDGSVRFSERPDRVVVRARGDIEGTAVLIRKLWEGPGSTTTERLFCRQIESVPSPGFALRS